MNQAELQKIGAVVTSVTVQANRKVGLPDYGSQGTSLELTANVSKDADVETVVNALASYAEAFCTKALEGVAKEVKQTTMPERAVVPVTGAGVEAPIGHSVPVADEPSTPAKEGDDGHTRIARFTLEPKPEGKFLLSLYPRIGNSAGKYVEIKFTADKAGMWAMLGAEAEDGWQLPVTKDVDWLVEWKLGREKTGPNAKPGSRYKDLVAIHGA